MIIALSTSPATIRELATSCSLNILSMTAMKHAGGNLLHRVLDILSNRFLPVFGTFDTDKGWHSQVCPCAIGGINTCHKMRHSLSLPTVAYICMRELPHFHHGPTTSFFLTLSRFRLLQVDQDSSVPLVKCSFVMIPLSRHSVDRSPRDFHQRRSQDFCLGGATRPISPGRFSEADQIQWGGGVVADIFRDLRITPDSVGGG